MNPHYEASHNVPPSHERPRLPAEPANITNLTSSSYSSMRAPRPHAAQDAGSEAFPFPSPAEAISPPPHVWRGSSATRNRSSASQDRRGRPELVRQQSGNPSIRIRRRSVASLRTTSHRGSVTDSILDEVSDERSGEVVFPGSRARSASQPERGQVHANTDIPRPSRAVPQVAMPRLTEEGVRPTLEDMARTETHLDRSLSPARSLPEDPTLQQPRPYGMVRKMSRFFWPGRGDGTNQESEAVMSRGNDTEYDDQLVDWLDAVDPEVQTLSTLTNIQNSLFVPNLGGMVNRRPTYVLSDTALSRPRPNDEESQIGGNRLEKQAGAGPSSLLSPPVERVSTISSRLTDTHYAALPHGTSLEGWSVEQKLELDDHVRHMLHSRRSKFKRMMKGFGQYVRRPLGFAVTLYATLITLFGLAWVLFLIGWIYVGDEQVYAIHIIDSVLVALFAIVGDGLAPFRAVDTYRMIHIVHYSRIMENAKKGKLPRRKSKLRKQNILNEPQDAINRQPTIDSSETQIETPQPTHQNSRRYDDIAPDAEQGLMQAASSNFFREPSPTSTEDTKYEPGADDADELWPLTPAQQKKFRHHQEKFAKSHSFYKPHETGTHFAFPLSYLIAIVILLDCHSCLQISLGATTWGIDYHTRHIAITTVILCVSITCNITAGLVITIGDRKTRKKEVHKLMDRQELTGDAIKKIEKKKRKNEERQSEDFGARSSKDMASRKSRDLERKKLTKGQNRDG